MRGLFIPVCHTLRMLGRGVLHDSAYLYVVILLLNVPYMHYMLIFYSFGFTCHRMAFIILHKRPRRQHHDGPNSLTQTPLQI